MYAFNLTYDWFYALCLFVGLGFIRLISKLQHFFFFPDGNEQSPAVLWVFEFIIGPAVDERSGAEEGTCRHGLFSHGPSVKVPGSLPARRDVQPSERELGLLWLERGSLGFRAQGSVNPYSPQTSPPQALAPLRMLLWSARGRRLHHRSDQQTTSGTSGSLPEPSCRPCPPSPAPR